MKRHLYIITICLFITSLYSTKKDFVQGIYISAYTAASKNFTSILDSAEVAGINTVVVDAKEMQGEIFLKNWKTSTSISHSYVRLLDLKEVNEEVKKHNMKLAVRVVMFYNINSALVDTFAVPHKKNGGLWTENGKASWLDPSDKTVQKDLLEFIEHIASLGINEIQMDYIRFPTQGKLEEAVFDFQKGNNNSSTTADIGKTEIIRGFLEKVRNICDKYNTVLSADTFAITLWQNKTDIVNTGQDIRIMTKYLNKLHPMVYSSHFVDNFGGRNNLWNEPYHIVYQSVQKTKEHCAPDCKIIPYIQANNYKVNYGKAYVYAQLSAIKDSNSDGYILWNARNNYYKTLSWIREYNKNM